MSVQTLDAAAAREAAELEGLTLKPKISSMARQLRKPGGDHDRLARPRTDKTQVTRPQPRVPPAKFRQQHGRHKLHGKQGGNCDRLVRPTLTCSAASGSAAGSGRGDAGNNKGGGSSGGVPFRTCWQYKLVMTAV